MTSKTKMIGIGVVVVLLLTFIVLFKSVLNAYEQEKEEHFTTIIDEKDVGPDHVNIRAKVTTVDPIKSEMKVRLEFIPEGSLKAADGYTLTQDLEVHVLSAVGKKEFQFKKGKPLDPFEVTIDLYGSEATDYPYDKYAADLNVFITTPKKTATPPATPPANADANKEGADAANPQPTATEDTGELSIAMTLEASVSGIKITGDHKPLTDKDYIEVDFKVARSSTVFFFSTFVTIAMWFITIVVVSLLLIVLIGGRKIEIGMFSFMSSLLFAFPALRNSQPGTPPIGSYSDYIAFFWVETLVALCLLTLITTWLLRPQK